MRARAISLLVAIVAATALVSASGAATTRAQKTVRIDVSTRGAVVHYLRSLHVDPKGLVIQRGARNYAGSDCPGKGWACAATTHVVVQVAKPGGKNMFSCSTGTCRVLQVASSSTATNTAKCVINTTGQLQAQACVIIQSSASANNVAVVYQKANGLSGLTQAAAVAASITQRATGASNSNTACVYQAIGLTGSTSSTGNVSVSLGAHQYVAIRQDSAHGGNSASSSASSSGTCAAGPLTQTQTLNSVVKGRSITQNENSASLGDNVALDIEQNQSSGFKGVATGSNSAIFSQTNSLTAVANTLVGPVNQTQSSTTGGIVGTVNQDSTGVETAQATQAETQCEDASTSTEYPLATCHTNDADAPAYSLTQTQYGPASVRQTANKLGRGRHLYHVEKGNGPSTQTGGNAADSFIIDQSSTQDTDRGTGSHQTNTVQGDCHTSGTCADTQTTTVDGQTTTNTQSGQNLDTSTNCTGSSCTKTVPADPVINTFPPNPSESSSATFTFSDTTSPVTFLCSLDGSPYTACSSGQTYTGLSDGPHTFSVEAKDQNGNLSDHPASYPWTIATAEFTQIGPQLTANNVDVARFGYGGMRADTGTTDTGNGTGSISVTGVTGTVLKALLYWNGPTSSADPGSNADVSFADTPITGTNIGTASSNCWGPGYGNSQSYMADVTSLVGGNGMFNLSDFIKTDGQTVTSDINGVALVVFYDDGNASNNRNVVLWAGNDSNIGNGLDPDGWNETLTGVPGSSSGGSLDLVVSDGQAGNGFDDGAVLVNGTTIVAAGGIFNGASTPAGPASASGDLWDVESFNLPSSLLGSISNTLNLTSASAGDCLSLVVAAADVPASAPVIP